MLHVDRPVRIEQAACRTRTAVPRVMRESVAVLQPRDLLGFQRSHRSTKRVRAIYNEHAMPQCVEARHNTKVVMRVKGRPRAVFHECGVRAALHDFREAKRFT